MATPWCRLWADMPNDPKWRTIARASKQRIGDVISVYVHMMICASNATERGRTQGWNDEDIGAALDLETEQVCAIREAMQGRVLDGDYLAGWDRRQSVREDETAAARAKAWRAEQKAKAKAAAEELKRTQANAGERKQTTEVEVEVEVEVDKEIEKNKPKSKAEARATRLPDDWRPTDADTEFCKAERPDLRPSVVASRFFDYWIAQPGAKGRKADWSATWRNWVRNEKPGNMRPSLVPGDVDAARKAANNEAKRRLGIDDGGTFDAQ